MVVNKGVKSLNLASQIIEPRYGASFCQMRDYTIHCTAKKVKLNIVASPGIEPGSGASETHILSIVQQGLE